MNYRDQRQPGPRGCPHDAGNYFHRDAAATSLASRDDGTCRARSARAVRQGPADQKRERSRRIRHDRVPRTTASRDSPSPGRMCVFAGRGVPAAAPRSCFARSGCWPRGRRPREALGGVRSVKSVGKTSAELVPAHRHRDAAPRAARAASRSTPASCRARSGCGRRRLCPCASHASTRS